MAAPVWVCLRVLCSHQVRSIAALNTITIIANSGSVIAAAAVAYHVTFYNDCTRCTHACAFAPHLNKRFDSVRLVLAFLPLPFRKITHSQTEGKKHLERGKRKGEANSPIFQWHNAKIKSSGTFITSRLKFNKQNTVISLEAMERANYLPNHVAFILEQCFRCTLSSRASFCTRCKGKASET